jgi:ABC transport system ATP-binding/permease protein
MLQPADVLLLDEPTNDLDIPTLEVLEERLLEFRGSLVLVTHDRYMLDRVSNIVLGLDGQGGAESFADYAQWDVWLAETQTAAKATGRSTTLDPSSSGSPLKVKKKLSYLEAREYASIEQRIADAEQLLRDKRAELENPTIASDSPKLLVVHAEMEAAQRNLDALYERWAELEDKSGDLPNSEAG